MDLDMKPYTAEFLRTELPEEAKNAASEGEGNPEENKRAGAAGGEGGEGEEADKDKDKDKEKEEEEEENKIEMKPDSYYKYRLKGVSIHTGTMNSGHYYSIIQDRKNSDGQWYKFNDRVVTKYNVEDLPDECFGGGHGPKSWGGRPNAYMLWYDRVEAAEKNQLGHFKHTW